MNVWLFFLRNDFSNQVLNKTDDGSFNPRENQHLTYLLACSVTININILVFGKMYDTDK